MDDLNFKALRNGDEVIVRMIVASSPIDGEMKVATRERSWNNVWVEANDIVDITKPIVSAGDCVVDGCGERGIVVTVYEEGNMAVLRDGTGDWTSPVALLKRLPPIETPASAREEQTAHLKAHAGLDEDGQIAPRPEAPVIEPALEVF